MNLTSIARTTVTVAAFAMLAACGSTTGSNHDEAAAGDTVDVRSGRYLNAQGGWLRITDFTPGKSLSFELSLTAPEQCAGVNMKGQATFDSARVAKTPDGGHFKLMVDGMNFEPSVSSIGMACARVLDTNFKRAR